MYFYQERTIRKDGDALAFIARYREGPNLPREDARLTPAELDYFGAQIAAALNQQEAARKMLAALKMAHAMHETMTAGDLLEDLRGIHPDAINHPMDVVENAIAAAEACGITEEA